MLGGEGCGRPREPPAGRFLPSFLPLLVLLVFFCVFAAVGKLGDNGAAEDIDFHVLFLGRHGL